MGKKVLIAAVAVVVALVVINFTRLGSHVRLWKQQTWTHIQAQIPPEQEIARLEMELKDLEKSDAQHYHKVAVQRVEVKDFEKQVEAFRDKVSVAEKRILAMEASLSGKDEFVTYESKRFARELLTDEVRTAARGFRTEEARLKALEQSLTARKQSLQINEEKLSKLKLTREQMASELAQLRAALDTERQAAAAEKETLDDANYSRTRDSLDGIRKRINVMKEERNLRGELNSPVRIHEERKKQQDEDDAYRKARFGGQNKQ